MLVVLGHGVQYSVAGGYERSLVFRAIYSFHMPLFFVLSGYLFREPFSVKEGLLRMRDRSLFLLAPFVFWTLFWYSCQAATNGFLAGNMAWKTIWFLPVLFACFSLHMAVALVCRGRATAARMSLAIFVTLLLYGIPYSNFWLSCVRYYYVFFLAGALVREYRLLARFHSRELRIASVALWLLLFPLWQFGASPKWLSDLISNPPMQTVVHSLFKVIVALLGVCSCYTIVLLLPRSVKSALSCIGLYTIQIYLIHIGLLESIYPHLALYGGWFWVCTVLMVLVPILIAVGAARNPYIDLLLFGRRISDPQGRCHLRAVQPSAATIGPV